MPGIGRGPHSRGSSTRRPSGRRRSCHRRSVRRARPDRDRRAVARRVDRSSHHTPCRGRPVPCRRAPTRAPPRARTSAATLPAGPAPTTIDVVTCVRQRHLTVPWAVSLNWSQSMDVTRSRTQPNVFARRLFAPLAGRYDRLAEILSMGQNRRWRTAMVEHITGPSLNGSGTTPSRCSMSPAGRHASVGRWRTTTDAHVVGLDLSRDRCCVKVCRASPRQALQDRITLLLGTWRAIALSRCHASTRSRSPTCCATSPTRQQPSPSWPVSSSPVGPIASLEFAVPTAPWWRCAWWVLHPSDPANRGIDHRRQGLVRRGTIPRTQHLDALPQRTPSTGRSMPGATPASTTIGTRRMSLGGGLVMWGKRQPYDRLGSSDRTARSLRRSTRVPSSCQRPAVRDWWTLLHPPYTLWHLSYVVIGSCLVGPVDASRLGFTLLAFFLAVGIGAHALDELHGRPLADVDPRSHADRRCGRRNRRRRGHRADRHQPDRPRRSPRSSSSA